MSGFLTPPPFKPEMAKEKIDSTYKNYRWQVFLGIFIGYAGFYIVRKNFSMAIPALAPFGFEKGEPVSLNNETMTPVELIRKLHTIASRFGIGRDIHVGDTIIGTKGRVAFEAPSPLILVKAHHLLEKHILTKHQLYWKDQLSNWYGQLLHEAQYLEPVMRNIETFLDDTQKYVAGEVEVELRPYHFSVLGCKPEYDLMSSKFGEYGETNKSFTGQDVIGFTKVTANPLKIYYSIHKDK